MQVVPDAVDNALWTRFYVSLTVSGVLGVLLVATVWGSFGAGTSTAACGCAMAVAACIGCCRDRHACLDKCNCSCGCDDCIDLKTIWHARNIMSISGIFASVALVPSLLVSIVLVADSGGCPVGRCRDLTAAQNCMSCWDSAWTSPNYYNDEYRWEYGLSEICWSSYLTQDQSGLQYDHDASWSCIPGASQQHNRRRGASVKGPSSHEECRELCHCMAGKYDKECSSSHVFGAVGLANAFVATVFAVSVCIGCNAAGRIIKKSGGPVAAWGPARIVPGPVIAADIVGRPVLGQPVRPCT